jgi:hypothetical protein
VPVSKGLAARSAAKITEFEGFLPYHGDGEPIVIQMATTTATAMTM